MVIKTQSGNTVVRTGLAAALHFCVDGLCLCCLYLATAGVSELLRYFVVYNVLAFLTQPLTGMLADRAKRRCNVDSGGSGNHRCCFLQF